MAARFLQQRLLRLGGVRHVDHLHLANEQGLGAAGEKAPLAAHQLGGGAQRRHDGRLLHRHGHHVVFVVDEKVEAQAHGNAQHADDIFHHLVGVGRGQDLLLAQQKLGVGHADDIALTQKGDALMHAAFVKLGDAGAIHGGLLAKH